MNVKQDTTLDILYNNKLKYFQNKSSIIIPKITKKMEELKGTMTLENEKDVKLKLEDYEKCADLLEILKAYETKKE